MPNNAAIIIFNSTHRNLFIEDGENMQPGEYQVYDENGIALYEVTLIVSCSDSNLAFEHMELPSQGYSYDDFLIEDETYYAY